MDRPVYQNAEISALLGDTTFAGPSSVPLGWGEVAVERRVAQPVELSELSINQHFLLLWDDHIPAEAKQSPSPAPWCLTEIAQHNYNLSARDQTSDTEFERAQGRGMRDFQRFLDQVETELDKRPSGSLHQLYGTDDFILRELILLLAKEMEAGGPSGKVYAESLSTALATRLLFAGRSLQQPRGPKESPLPRRILRRVLARMEDQLDSDLTLTLLAAESGYSRTHFHRMFKAATGQAPHRYLLELRLKKAKSLLADPSLSLIDIAFACGFSSHAHFSTAFRTRYGVSPSEYRSRFY